MAAVLGGGGLYIVKLIGDNSVLKASAKSDRLAIKGWSSAAMILSDKYQTIETEKNDRIKKITRANVAEIVKANPGRTAIRINNATRSLFDEFESATRRNRATTTATP